MRAIKKPRNGFRGFFVVRLPTGDEFFPTVVVVDMFLEVIEHRGGWLARGLLQVHASLFGGVGTLLMVAMDTGCYDVIPGVGAMQCAGNDMVDCQFTAMQAAVLAGIAIASKNFMPGELNLRPGTLDHIFEPDDRRDRVGCRDGVEIPSSILDEGRLVVQDETERPPCVADMYGFKVGVQYED
jgi:hypothetical protein